MAIRRTSNEGKAKKGPAKKKNNSAKQSGASRERIRPVTRAKRSRKIHVVSSKLSYDGPLFRVFTDTIRENGRVTRRDVIRHDGSAVILAIDTTRSKQDPLVVLECQYRHAAKQHLLEVPAGKLEKGEDPLRGAKRELLEETGFQAKRWRRMARYYASPGFLGEWMQVYLAEGLTPGVAEPEYDEQIEIQMLPLSEVLRRIEQGRIQDGKTLISVMLYDRLRRRTGRFSARTK